MESTGALAPALSAILALSVLGCAPSSTIGNADTETAARVESSPLCDAGWTLVDDNQKPQVWRHVECSRGEGSEQQRDRRYFDENGVLRDRKQMRKGKLHGFAQEWNADGELTEINEYRYGEIAARARDTRDDGEPRPSVPTDGVHPCPDGAVVAGKSPPGGYQQWCERLRTDGLYERHGTSLVWELGDDGPVLVSRCAYRDGAREGTCPKYSQSGDLIEESTFEAGRAVPPYRKWIGPAGELRLKKERVEVDGGLRIREWSNSGVLVLELQQNRDGVQVRHTEWYETGTLLKEGTTNPSRTKRTYREWWPKGQLRVEHEPMLFGLGSVAKKFGPDGELLSTTSGPPGYRREQHYAVYDDPAPENALSRPGLLPLTLALLPVICPAGSSRVEESERRSSVVGCVRDSPPTGSFPLPQCVASTAAMHGPMRIKRTMFVQTCTYDADGRLHGALTTWKRGVEVKTYAGGELDGPSAAWWPNHARKEVGSYSRNKKTGPWMTYNVNGRRESQSSYLDGEKDGEWLRFAYDGSVRSRDTYSSGKRDGVRAQWDQFGRPKLDESYRDDKLHGLQRRWEEGRLLSEVHYADGKQSGESADFFPDGGVRRKGSYSDGLRTGRWTWFHRDGSVDSRGDYDRGHRVGDWEFFHPGGQLRMAGAYAFCERGPRGETNVRENGALETMTGSDSCRVGPWTYFAGDGRVVGVFELDQRPQPLRPIPPPPRPRARRAERGGPCLLNLGSAGVVVMMDRCPEPVTKPR